MARSRNIKPGFFMNETLAECSTEVRLLFIGLWTLADREGRLEDRPRRIKAELFPFDAFDVDPMLARLQADGFVVRYEASGVRYIQIENFVKHQDPHYKEKASQIPAPDGRENLILASGVTRTQRARIFERDGFACVACKATDALCIDHVLPVSRGGDSSDENLQTLCTSCNTKKGNKLDGEEKNSRQRRINVGPNLNQRNDASPSDSLIPDSGSLIPDSSPQIPDSFVDAACGTPKPAPAADAPATQRGTRLAADWQLPKAWGEWALSEMAGWTHDTVRLESSKFRDYWVPKTGKDATKLDWLGTWRNWCRNARPAPLARSAPSPANTAQRDAEAARLLGFDNPTDVIEGTHATS